MKHAAIPWLIAAVCLLFIGGLVFAGAMAVNGWDFAALGNNRYETSTFDIDQAFCSISITSDTEDISFLPSEDGKCRVVFYEQEKVKPSASVEGETLTISVVDTRTWSERITLFSDSPTITVCLPQEQYASLFIEESTGDIAIPKEFRFEGIDISVSTGNVDCSASCSGTIRIQTSTGDIHLEDVTAKELTLSVSTGKVQVHSAVCQGDIEVTVSTGKVFLSDVACQGFVSAGNTGDITLENVLVSGTIAIERSTGDVRFDHCDAADLQIKTDTGDVTGSLLSQKRFLAKSDTGRIDVPDSTDGGECKITTDTGNIAIAIE